MTEDLNYTVTVTLLVYMALKCIYSKLLSVVTDRVMLSNTVLNDYIQFEYTFSKAICHHNHIVIPVTTDRLLSGVSTDR